LKTKFSILTTFLFLFLGIGWWLTFNLVRSNLDHIAETPNQPDIFMTNVTYWKMDPVTGLATHQLTTSKITHHPLDDEYDLTAPEATILSSEKQLWKIQANYGKSKQNQIIIDLSGNVNIQQFSDLIAKNPSLSIATEALTFYPEKQYAETKQPLLITQPNSAVKAVGGNMDFKENILQLSSMVEGQYTPEKKTGETSPQPAMYKANQAKCQEKNNLCIYTGDVKFNQGTSAMDAPNILVYRDNSNIIQKILATGTPAHYQTINDQTKKPLNATAQKIEIFPLQNLMTLTGTAEIDEEQNKFTSDYIKYDIKKQTIMSLPNPNSLTTIFLPPQP